MLASLAELHRRVSQLATAAELERAVAAIEGRPALATLTIQCDRADRVDPNGLAESWMQTCLGGEAWLFPGQATSLVLYPQLPIKNLRWFVSGHPDIVCDGLVVANEHTNAAYGGTKFGDWRGRCLPGSAITAKLRRVSL